jgi:hypothetical protein
MQDIEKDTAEKAGAAEPMKYDRRIGATTYKIAVYYSQTSKDTLPDKILRLIKSEVAGR